MTLFIQGLAVPLNVKNKNGWGIPAADADNVIKSFPTSTLKICPGEAHACDYTGDPNGIIGRYASHWLEADGIHAKYEVTDSVAQRKLKEGTWDGFKWSMYGGSKTNPILNDGWASGTTVKNMTLVRNPAWEQAQYQITASADDTFTEIRLFSDFTLIASGDDQIPTDDELKAAQTKITDMQKEIESLKKEATVSASTIEDQKKQITTLSASVADKEKALNVALNDVTEAKTSLEKATEENGKLTASVNELNSKLDEKTTLVASLEKDKARSVPMDQLNTLIASAIEKHDTEKEEKATLSAARDRFVAARKELGMETKTDEFTTLSAADFDTMTEMLSVKLAAGGAGSGPQIKYASEPISVDYSFATGAYDAKTGAFHK